MANKLTNEKLKELINEVLSEQVLNEKTNYPFDPDSEYKDVFGNNYNDILGATDKKDGFEMPSQDKYVKARMKKVASLDGDKTKLDIPDLDDAMKMPKSYKDTVKAISIKGRNPQVRKAANNAVKGITTGPPPPPPQGKYPAPASFTTGGAFIEAIDKAITDYTNNSNNALAKKAITDYTNFITNLQGRIANQKGVQAKLPKLQRAIGILLSNPNSSNAQRAIQAVNSLMDAINKGIAITDRELDPLGRAPRMASAEFESAKSLKSLGSQTDSSTIAAFSAITGNTLEEKFKNIADFSDEVNKKDIDSAKTKYKLTDEALVNMVFVLTYIGDLSRTLSASEAGVEFEKVLALLMGAAKVGKQGGGLDVVQKTGKNKFALYSSKFQNSGTITQSYSSTNGLHNQLENNKPVYYVLARKAKGGSDEYQEIKIFLFKMEPTSKKLAKKKTVDPQAGDVKVIDATGNERAPTSTAQHWSTVKDGKVTKFSFSAAGIKSTDAAATLKVPISKGVNKTIKSTANYMADKITNSSQQMLKSISSVYQRLQNLELNTREYMGVKAGGKGTTTATNYIAQLQADYSGIKTDYNKALGGTTIKENKKNQTKSLKDLDKLIERVIIESMNKK